MLLVRHFPHPPNGDQTVRIILPDGPMGAAFHVTEIKHHKITSLDCGRGQHAWEEVVIQLLDGNSGQSLTARKLRGILSAAPTVNTLPLAFEGGLQNRMMARFKIAAVEATPEIFTLSLTPDTATCKPAAKIGQPSCCAA